MIDKHDFVTKPLDHIEQVDRKIQSQSSVKVLAIRDIVHAAKLLRLLKAKESLIASQLDCVRTYLKENS